MKQKIKEIKKAQLKEIIKSKNIKKIPKHKKITELKNV